jgi:hypothetical protein
MKRDDLPYFPYPPDPLTRFGFIIADLVTLAIMLLIGLPVVWKFLG